MIAGGDHQFYVDKPFKTVSNKNRENDDWNETCMLIG